MTRSTSCRSSDAATRFAILEGVQRRRFYRAAACGPFRWRAARRSHSPPERDPHPLDRDLRLAEHELRLDPKHAPPEPRELAIAASIGGGAARVARTINFDGQLRSGHREVDHEFTDDDLPADGNTELARTDQPEQRLLAPGGSCATRFVMPGGAHGRRARKEELTAFLFPMHEDLLARRRVRALPDHGAGGVTGAERDGAR